MVCCSILKNRMHDCGASGTIHPIGPEICGQPASSILGRLAPIPNRIQRRMPYRTNVRGTQMRAFLLLLTSAMVVAGCQTAQTVKTTKQGPTTVDEYAVLDDTKPSKPITDQVLNKQLEEARRQYVMALRASQQNRESVAAQHFEAALATLNDLSTYPNIDSYPEVDKLAQSIIRDYEEQVSSLDSLDPNSNFLVLRDKMFQEIESIPVERKQYPKADPKTGLVENTDEAPELQVALSENEKVEQCIAFFTATEKGRKIFGTWLERTGRYFPMYERVMEEEGVPDEIKHLSMIESGLKPTAVSWAKAAGLWQFIPSTGQMYGMAINWYVDERRDPEKATRAAARYLRDLYQDLGDWHLALASYNCGPGRVKSAIAKANSRDYWVVRQYLPRETQQYVPLFIAATKITMSPETYGFTNIRYMTPDEYDTLSVKTSFSLADLAKASGVTTADLKDLNPELLREELPASTPSYCLKVPVAARQMMISALESLPEPEKPRVTFVRHKVGRGESITKISKRYGVSTNDIYAANQMTSKSKLRRGAVLKIPITSKPEENAGDAPLLAKNDAAASTTTAANTPPAATAPATASSKSSASIAAKQQPSEPLAVASAPRRTRSEAVAKQETVASGTNAPATTAPAATTNNTREKAPAKQPASSPALASAAPKPATTEAVPPAKKLVTKSVTKTTHHKVARNESVASIAKRYGVKSSDLIEWNRLGKKGSLKAGQSLAIKKTVKVQEWVAVKTEEPKKNNGGGSASIAAGTQQQKSQSNPVALKTKGTVPAATATEPEEAAELAEAATDKAATIAPPPQAAAAKPEQSKNRGIAAAAPTAAKKPEPPAKVEKAEIAKAEPPKVSSKKKPVTTTSTKYETHKVKPGESLSAVADQYGVSVNDLKAWNENTIKGSTLLSGTKLRIYSESPSKGDAKKNSRVSRSSRGKSKPASHAIKQGETLEAIAKRHGVSVSDLKKLNPKLKETQLQIGQKVKVRK